MILLLTMVKAMRSSILESEKILMAVNRNLLEIQLFTYKVSEYFSSAMIGAAGKNIGVALIG